MKILQISSAQSLGGGERHLADLTNGLAKAGHEMYVALRPGSPLVDELQSVPRKNLRTLPLRNSLDTKSARDLAKLVKKEQIEIVHAHMARDYPLAAYATRGNPTALIVTRHVLFPLNRLHRITLSRAARVIAVSRAVAAQLSEDEVVAPERISIVLNGIEASRFVKAKEQFNKREFLRAWKLPEDHLLVGTVGELSPLKGQREFLLAAARLIEMVPNVSFIVAGVDHSPDNRNRALCEKLIGELALTGRVRLVGWLDDLAELYCALDVFASASHTESFGLAIVEAMASGTAVVATATEGAREILEVEETGLLVTIGDVEKLTNSIAELLKDGSRRRQISVAGQRVAVERFGVERMIKETEDIYKAAIENPS